MGNCMAPPAKIDLNEPFVIGRGFTCTLLKSSIERGFAIEPNIERNAIKGIRLILNLVHPVNKFPHPVFIHKVSKGLPELFIDQFGNLV